MQKVGSADDTGFTLVEVMVVVIVIGVLIAVGIPTLLGARSRAADMAAKAQVRHAAKVQLTHASDADQRFADASETMADEPSVKAETYVPGDTKVMGVVYVRLPAPDAPVVTLMSRSATGTCFWTEVEGGKTRYAKNDCDGEPTVFSDSW